jgi:hypothetical protein
MIHEVVERQKQNAGHPRNATVGRQRFELPAEHLQYIGRIIGQSGSGIKQIKKATGVIDIALRMGSPYEVVCRPLLNRMPCGHSLYLYAMARGRHLS